MKQEVFIYKVLPVVIPGLESPTPIIWIHLSRGKPWEVVSLCRFAHICLPFPLIVSVTSPKCNSSSGEHPIPSFIVPCVLTAAHLFPQSRSTGVGWNGKGRIFVFVYDSFPNSGAPLPAKGKREEPRLKTGRRVRTSPHTQGNPFSSDWWHKGQNQPRQACSLHGSSGATYTQKPDSQKGAD